jgi:hypothetical protein
MNTIDQYELELECLDEIYVAGDEEQTYINYLAATKNQWLLNYYYIEDPFELHYEVAMRISQLIELIDLHNELNLN